MVYFSGLAASISAWIDMFRDRKKIASRMQQNFIKMHQRAEEAKRDRLYNEQLNQELCGIIFMNSAKDSAFSNELRLRTYYKLWSCIDLAAVKAYLHPKTAKPEFFVSDSELYLKLQIVDKDLFLPTHNAAYHKFVIGLFERLAISTVILATKKHHYVLPRDYEENENHIVWM